MNRKMPAVLALPNGQIFSKLIFGLPKNKPTNSFFLLAKKPSLFVRFFGRNRGYQKSFEII